MLWNGRNGGAQRTVLEVLMEMKRLNGEAKEEDQGAVALVLDLAKAFGRVSLPGVWAWATHFSFPRKILRVLFAFISSTRGGYSSKDVRQSRYGPSQPSCQGPNGVACGLRMALQDALSEVIEIYPSAEVEGFLWMTSRHE